MKYLIIFENGSMQQIEEITKDDIQSVADGYCDIVKVVEMNFQIMNCDGKWDEVRR